MQLWNKGIKISHSDSINKAENSALFLVFQAKKKFKSYLLALMRRQQLLTRKHVLHKTIKYNHEGRVSVAPVVLLTVIRYSSRYPLSNNELISQFSRWAQQLTIVTPIFSLLPQRSNAY